MSTLLRRVGLAAATLVAVFITVVSLAGSAAAAGETIDVVDTGDALVNGQNMLAAVQQARSLNPTAEDRVTIQLAAGVFDIGGVTSRLPDGVDIVGAGIGETDLCDCARIEAGEVQLGRQWFQVRGANRFAHLTFRDGGQFIVTNYSDADADLTLDFVEVQLKQQTTIPQSYASPSTLASMENGSLTFRDSAIVIVPTDRPTLRPRDQAFMDVARGDVSIIDSNVDFRPYWNGLLDPTATGKIEIIRSTSYQIAAYDTSEFRAEDSTFTTLTVGRRGAPVPIVLTRNEIVSYLKIESSAPFLISDTDVVASRGIELFGRGEIIGGSIVNPVSATADSKPAAISIETIGDGVAIESVAMVNYRIVGDEKVSCTDTTNDDVIFGVDGSPDQIVASHTPPLTCGVGPVPYPDGQPHVVPGWIEAENYDDRLEASELAYDPPTAPDGAYRDDDAEGLVQEMVGEDGYYLTADFLEEHFYTFEVPVAGVYGFRFRAGDLRYANRGRGIRMYIDDMYFDTFLPVSAESSFVRTPTMLLYLEAGTHELGFLAVATFNLDRIEVTAFPNINPAPPANLRCVVDGETISWNNPGVTVQVERSTDGASWQLVATIRPDRGQSFNDGPFDGARYRIRGDQFAPVGCTNMNASEPEPEPEPVGFACSVSGSIISWTDVDAPKYWVYRSTDGGATWQWIAGTAATSTIDANPPPGAIYQAHYAGISRVDCAIDETPEPEAPSFECSVSGSTISWPDVGADRYWVYRSADNGATWQWIAGTAATSTIDANPPPGAIYQAHHGGIARVDCTTSDDAEQGIVALPAVIEAENYTRAIDTEPGNQGAAMQFGGDVDVWPIPGRDGHVVGRIRPGESTSYVATVADAGSYTFSLRTSSGADGGKVTVRVDGQKVGATTDLGSTGGWWTFTDTTIGSKELSAGRHTITVQWGDGQSNFDNLTVAAN